MNNNLNKCPVCGAPRSAMSTKCICDYEYSDTPTVVISELNERFDELRKLKLSKRAFTRQQLDIIKSFAIPQIAAEILDIMIYIQPKALDQDNEISAAAWRSRQKEVIARAKIAFEKNSKAMAMINNYESELKKYEKKTFGKVWKKMPFIGKLAAIILFLFVLLLIIPAKDTSPEAYAVRFNKAIGNEEVNKALKYLDECPTMGTMIADDYLTLIDLLIAEGRMIEAENLYKSISTYTSSSNDKTHIRETKNRLMSYYMDKGDAGHAQKFADDASSLSLIIRHYLDNSDYDSALSLYKKNSTKLVKYVPSEKKRVVLSEDEVVVDFIKANSYGLQ